MVDDVNRPLNNQENQDLEYTITISVDVLKINISDFHAKDEFMCPFSSEARKRELMDFVLNYKWFIK